MTDVKYKSVFQEYGNGNFIIGDWWGTINGGFKSPETKSHANLIGHIQYTGLKDRLGNEIYADDLLTDEDGVQFRIYHVYGGFVHKAHYWMKNIKDLVPADELIFCPLSDPQTAQWIKENCVVTGNMFDKKPLIV